MIQEISLSTDDPDSYIAAAFATDDPASIAKALGEVARMRNMSKLAKDVGMNRSALYRALSGDGNPEFATILKVVKALGLKLTPVPTTRCEPGAL